LAIKAGLTKPHGTRALSGLAGADLDAQHAGHAAETHGFKSAVRVFSRTDSQTFSLD